MSPFSGSSTAMLVWHLNKGIDWLIDWLIDWKGPDCFAFQYIPYLTTFSTISSPVNDVTGQFVVLPGTK